jgi:hypothetical protein
MPLMSDIFDIPAQVHQGDFVLRLTEGIERAADTLGTYVVTPQLVICFDQALNLIKSASKPAPAKVPTCTAALAAARVILWRC